MALRWGSSHDPRALPILAKTIYRGLRTHGFDERHVMALASELLNLVVAALKTKRDG